MSPSDTVTSFIRAIERNDLDVALALVDASCEYDNVPIGKVHGPDGIRSVLAPMLDGATTVEWVVHRQVGDGPVVFNERLDRFHMPFGWIEIPVTGVWEVRDGVITLWRDYFDEMTYRRQLPPATS
jgi:limonene-1,2-epoxide hydrolase